MANRFNTQEIVPVAGGGSYTVDLDKGIQHVYVCPATSITLAAATNIVTTGTAVKHQYVKFIYCGNITTDTSTGKSVNIFGTELTDAQALYEAEITAFYNGSAWEVRILADDESGNASVSGSDIVDASITTAKLADNVITLAKMNDITRGQFIVGGTSDAPTYLNASTSGNILIGDGTDLTSTAVTGDVTISSAGVTSIGSGKITESMLSFTPVNYAEVNTTLTADAIPGIFYGAGGATEILAAPGAGKVNVVVRAVAFLDYNSATFTSGGDVVLSYNTSGTDPIGTLDSTVVTAVADTLGHFNMEQFVATSSINQPIYIGNLTGAFATGNSPLKVSLIYYTVDFN
jgi:hypothetical protein